LAEKLISGVTIRLVHFHLVVESVARCVCSHRHPAQRPGSHFKKQKTVTAWWTIAHAQRNCHRMTLS